MSDNLNKLDHEAQAVSRLLTQFREAPNLQGYIKALMSEANPIECALIDTLAGRSINTAIGAQLDVLGVIVGQQREVIDASPLTFFGYAGAPGAEAYGAARYLSEGEPTTGTRLLTDDEYRLFIKARIAKNQSRGDINGLVDLISFLIDSTGFAVIDSGGAEFSVGFFFGTLTNNEKVFISQSDLIPKPAGVKLNLFEYPAGGAFGYAGAPGVIAGYDVGQYIETF